MKLAALALMTTLGLGGAAYADPAPQRGQFRQLLLERFDRNHDGRLEPQERRHAARVLRKLASKLERRSREVQDDKREREALERQDRHGHRGEWRPTRARALRRFDSNGDGVVGPEEMPPGLARKLRRLDRNRDGWLDERDGARPDRGPRFDRGPAPGDSGPRLDRGPAPDTGPRFDSGPAPNPGPRLDGGPAPGDDGDPDQQ
jgi:hypothetical protein